MSRAAGWLRALAVVAAVLLADQVTKAVVRSEIGRGERHDLVLGVDLVNVRNDGIAFGLFGGGGAALTIFTLAAVVLLVAYFAWHADRPWLWLPVGLLLGGALGNLIDRIRDGHVTDFIDPPRWPAFNVADIAITFGVVCLLLVLELGARERAAASH